MNKLFAFNDLQCCWQDLDSMELTGKIFIAKDLLEDNGLMAGTFSRLATRIAPRWAVAFARQGSGARRARTVGRLAGECDGKRGIACTSNKRKESSASTPHAEGMKRVALTARLAQ